MIWWLVVALVAAAAIGFAGALAVRSKQEYDDRLAVVPGQSPQAPRAWAGAHTPEAKLHRRLVAAVRAARVQPGADGPLAEPVRRLEYEARALDERLIAAAALPAGHAATAIADFEPLVAELEATVASLSRGAAGELGIGGMDAVIRETEIHLEALARAREEVERADRRGTDPA